MFVITNENYVSKQICHIMHGKCYEKTGVELRKVLLVLSFSGDASMVTEGLTRLMIFK